MMEITVRLTRIDCGACGGVYAITETHHDWCEKHGKAWNCPYCRTGWGYVGIGKLDKLRQRAERAEQKIAQLHDELENSEERCEAQKRKTTAQKALVTRLKNKARDGKCPCCNKSFPDLAAHMESEHPEYAGDHPDYHKSA